MQLNDLPQAERAELERRLLHRPKVEAGRRASNAQGSATGSATDGPCPDAGHFPLSFAQQGVWFVHQIDPASLSFNVATAVGINGQIRMTCLELAAASLVRRHEALRTHFDTHEGQPMQVVSRVAPLVHCVELSGPAGAALGSQWRDHFGWTVVNRVFDVGRAPLFRIVAISFAHDKHVVVCSCHHLIADEWSMALLVQDLAVLYGDLCLGRPSSLEAPATQYSDYCAWQREHLTPANLAEQQLYWSRQISDDLVATELPLDKPRPAVSRFRGDREFLRFPRELTCRLKALGMKHGCSL
ncbi:MAG TPA: condensation domain-containing protein, partial [Polyangiaceae bacterium]|nr:condensation domain-containing protein [Polyangiaceae bacterium]